MDLHLAPPGPDKGLVLGLTSKEKSELTAANSRIAELETELRAARRAVELLREEASPKAVLGGQVMVAEKIRVQVACRVLAVSESGYSTPQYPGQDPT